MTLDDKLKSWREDTEALAPSSQLLEKLQATVDAPPPAATPAAAVVKVLLVTAFVGVIAWAVLRSHELGSSWFAKTPVAAVGLPDAGEAPCSGPRDGTAPSMMMPGLQLDEARAFGEQLATRPLSCFAQRHPLEQLARWTTADDPEHNRLLARLAVLCGPDGSTREVISGWVAAPAGGTRAARPRGRAPYCPTGTG